MLSATHLFNTALHVKGVTHGHYDQSHTVRTPLEYRLKPPSEALRKGIDSLAYTESLRPVCVRGGAPFEQGIADTYCQNFTAAKRIFLGVIGKTAGDREWSEVCRDT
jgi:hypothetical protein